MTPEFPENYHMTVEQLALLYEGKEFPAAYPNKSHFECDFCSVGVPYSKNPRVGHYISDGVAIPITNEEKKINNQRMLSPFATYCETCTDRNIYYPAEGYTEVRSHFTIGSDKIMRDFEVADISPQDEGIPWSPGEILKKITQRSEDEIKAHASKHDEPFTTAPENIATMLFSIGEIDIRELVDRKGNINPKVLGQARRKFDETSARTHSRDQSEKRRNFRDIVREHWHE